MKLNGALNSGTSTVECRRDYEPRYRPIAVTASDIGSYTFVVGGIVFVRVRERKGRRDIDGGVVLGESLTEIVNYLLIFLGLTLKSLL